MCGVDAHITAAVGAGLFDCDLAGRRTHRYELLGDDLCIETISPSTVTVSVSKSITASSRISPSALTAIGSTRDTVSALFRF